MNITNINRRIPSGTSLIGPFSYLGFLFLCLLAVIPATAASATRTLAILPFNNGKDSVASAGEKHQIVQSIHGIARRNLPKADGWVILAGENLETRAAGANLSGCEDEACVISLGRKLQVDYIVAGDIGRVGPYMEASFSLYDVSSGQLLGSEWPRGKTVEDIVDSLEASPDPLFAALGGSGPEVGASSQPMVTHVYTATPQVVTYYRRPVYVNPLVWLWIPLLVLFFWIPATEYHHR